MDYSILCFKCKKEFIADISNIRIVGPHIEVTCPFCKNFTDRNVSKFAELQIESRLNTDPRKPIGGLIAKAKYMQRFFQALEALIVESGDARDKHKKSADV